MDKLQENRPLYSFPDGRLWDLVRRMPLAEPVGTPLLELVLEFQLSGVVHECRVQLWDPRPTLEGWVSVLSIPPFMGPRSFVGQNSLACLIDACDVVRLLTTEALDHPIDVRAPAAPSGDPPLAACEGRGCDDDCDDDLVWREALNAVEPRVIASGFVRTDDLHGFSEGAEKKLVIIGCPFIHPLDLQTFACPVSIGGVTTYSFAVHALSALVNATRFIKKHNWVR